MRSNPAWAQRLALSFALALAAGTASAAPFDAQPPAPAETLPSPVAMVDAVVEALRANDVEALAEAMHDKSTEELAKEWEASRAKAAEQDEIGFDAESERLWAQLSTPQGKAALLAELQPKFAQQANDAVIQFNLGLAGMLAAVQSDKDVTAEQAKQYSQVVLAVQRWANDTDWSDPKRLSRALDAAQRLVQGSGLATPRELALLPYEDALALGDDAIVAVKDILRAYDVDIDATLASIRTEVVMQVGDRALVRYEARVFDVPLSHMQSLRYYSGRWMEADMADRWEQIEHDESATEVGAAAAALEGHAAVEPDIDVEFGEPPPPVEKQAAAGSCGNPDAETPAPWSAAPLN